MRVGAAHRWRTAVLVVVAVIATLNGVGMRRQGKADEGLMWILGGALAVLVVMFLDWYEVPPDLVSVNAWESFAVNDVILAVAAVLALTAFVLTVMHPTAAVPLALSSLATLVAVIALILITIRLISTPDVEGFDTSRLAGAWLGLIATAVLTAGCLGSIRDERLPCPENAVEPRFVQP